MNPTLADRACIPCRKGAAALDGADAEALAGEVPDWSLCDGATRIERRLAFADFASAYGFVQQVAAIADAADHHPDIAFGWGYVRLSLHTHAIGGLHTNDFIVAARLDAALASTRTPAA